MTYSLGGHVRRFLDFAEGFRTGSERDVANVDLKIRHSMRVLEEAEGLARDLGMAPEEARGPLLAALYHDTGRFPQYRDHKTFKDADSEDHARLGARTLLRLGMLADEPPSLRRVAVGAVRLHNVRKVPDGLVPALDTAVRLVRDADKLDIMRVMIREMKANGMTNPVVNQGAENDSGRYSTEISRQVLSGSMADVTAIRYVNDYRLLLASWIYDINLEPALRRVHERGYVQIIMEDLPKDEHIASVRAKVLADLGRGISGLPMLFT